MTPEPMTLPSTPLQIDASRATSALDARLAAVRDGDQAALERMLEALLPDIRRWLYRLMGPRPDVEDATQDALIELARSLPSFQGRSSLHTFARRITVRVAYRYYKRRGRAETLSDSLEVVAHDDPESTVLDREALAHLHRLLADLPEKRRVAFLLCCVEGLSPREAAEIEGTNSLSMRSRVHHARATVRKKMAQDPALYAWLDDRGGAR